MAKKSQALVNLEFAGMRAFFFLLGLLPRAAAIKVSTAIIRLVPVFAPSLRRIALRNLEIAFPEKRPHDREAIFSGMLENLGRVLGDLSQFHKYTPERLRELIDFELDAQSQELYRINKQEKRGVLVITGHLGNWEMLVLGFAALYEPISYLARPLDNPKIDHHLNRLRTRYGSRPINKRHSARTAIRILSEGGILGILSDVNAQAKEGVFVPFFGEQACTPSGAAVMAMRSRAFLYPTFCVWDKAAGRYKIVHGRILKPVQSGSRDRDITETTALFTAEIEKMIREYPDQWMWLHRRWKTRPDGEDDLYKK